MDPVTSLELAVAKCALCGKPAMCFGSYEGQPEAYACNDCCGHGNEDGHCTYLTSARCSQCGETYSLCNCTEL